MADACTITVRTCANDGRINACLADVSAEALRECGSGAAANAEAVTTSFSDCRQRHPQDRPSDQDGGADRRPVRHPAAKFRICLIVDDGAERLELPDLLIERGKLADSVMRNPALQIAAMKTINMARSSDRGCATTRSRVARGDSSIPISR